MPMVPIAVGYMRRSKDKLSGSRRRKGRKGRYRYPRYAICVSSYLPTPEQDDICIADERFVSSNTMDACVKQEALDRCRDAVQPRLALNVITNE